MIKVETSQNLINGQHSFFLEYYNKIFNGGWIAGEEIKMVLRNLYADLFDPRWDYDQTESHDRIEFAELFCIQTKHRFHGKPIKYMLWQKARKEVTFSFKYAGTNKRRFQQVFELVARKNGKSTDKASEGNVDLFMGQGGLDICCSSNDDAQADLIYQEINNMRMAIDPDNKWTKTNRKGIVHIKNRTVIFKISDRTVNKEGRNIYAAYIDEIHEMADNVIFMSIWQSTSTVENPLVYEITTEGVVEDGYLDKRLRYVRQVLNKEIIDDKLLPWLYTQDSEEEVWQDEQSWWKSNPSMGSIKLWDYLRSNVETAKVNREDRAYILCKDFNIKQNMATAWLLESEVANDSVFDIAIFRDSYYIGGIDLSETTDLTAAEMMFYRNGVYYFYTMYFVPESKALEKVGVYTGTVVANTEQKDYLAWQQQNLVVVLPGTEVNDDAVAHWYWDMFEQYNVKPFKIGYDKWHAKGLVKHLEEMFGENICEKVSMDFNTLSNPMRSLGADLKLKIVNYNNNPISRWCLKNVGIKVNNVGQIMPIKNHGSSSNRIDGAMSKIICYAVKSLYHKDFTFLVNQSIINNIGNTQSTNGGGE